MEDGKGDKGRMGDGRRENGKMEGEEREIGTGFIKRGIKT